MVTINPKSWLKSFRGDERGSIAVEAVITLPLLIWAVGATYEFFDLHRYNSTRDKASYTIADMISREQGTTGITPAYIDNAKDLFDTLTNDNGDNSLRISIISYNSTDEDYFVVWSRVRGTQGLKRLKTSDVKDDDDHLPKLSGGEQLILVESASIYRSVIQIGLSDDLMLRTRVMTSPRFIAQIKWTDSAVTG